MDAVPLIGWTKSREERKINPHQVAVIGGNDIRGSLVLGGTGGVFGVSLRAVPIF
jgi:hypothetical protein